MWARKRIDISAADLLLAGCYCFGSKPIGLSESQIDDCFYSDQLLVSLSVRSGFDLALTALDWPAGSEILFSGYTIPDMPRLAALHGCIPVGVDLDWQSMTPSAALLEASITPRTRAIVIAHLLGGQCDLHEIIQIARRHHLLLIEDCAQSYIGNHYQGDHNADLSLFSFGPIKTNTSLGGAVLFVREQELLTRMQAIQVNWPVQTKRDFAARIFRCGLVKALSSWPVAAVVRVTFQAFGATHDDFASKLARSFPGNDFLDKIRRRPSSALVRLLAHRIGNYSDEKVARRRELGGRLAAFLDGQEGESFVLGREQLDPSYWVFAVLTEEPQRLARLLWNHGFDATTQSSLIPVEGGSEASDLAEVNAIHRAILFLPFDVSMPVSEIERMANVIRQAGIRLPDSIAIRTLSVSESAQNRSPLNV